MCILLSKPAVTTGEEEGHGESVEECGGLKKKILAWILYKAEHEVRIKELTLNLEGIIPRH